MADILRSFAKLWQLRRFCQAILRLMLFGNPPHGLLAGDTIAQSVRCSDEQH